MKIQFMKKTVAASLTLMMLAGGGTAAFAKGDDQSKGMEKMNPGHGPKGNTQIQLNFNDMKNSQWAMRYIASLASRCVFEGYEDGTFKPDNAVSRIEAITAAVRLMGLRDLAESPAEMQTKLNFKDADKVPSWAVGYVAVALENNLFSENDNVVQPQQPADRLWATTILVKALKLEADAKAKMNTTLKFKDAKQIPAGSVGYVAVAIERGLIDGFEDNTFRPNQMVTRAQLAALLDRTGNQLPDQDQNSSSGTVSAVVNNNVLSLTKSGSVKQYVLHSDAFILRDGVKVSASALQVGDEVKIRTYNNTVVFVEVTKMAQQSDTTTTGTVSSLVTNNTLKLTKSGLTYSYTLSSNVYVYRNGVQAAVSALQVGDEVNVRTSGNQVYYIEVTKMAQESDTTTTGTLSSIVTNNLVTVTKSGLTYSYTLSSNVYVYRNGVQVTVSALQVGDEVNVRISGNQVYYIEVTKLAQVNQTFDVFGFLEGTTFNSQGKLTTVSIKQNINGVDQTTIYNVSADVTLTGNLSSFTQGRLVELKGQNQLVTSIDVK